MGKWYSRSELGLRSPKFAHPRGASPITGITVHWTGSGGTLYNPNQITRLRGIQNYHMDVRGYADIAYNAAFDDQGNVYSLRSNDVVGAHAASNGNLANKHHLGIVFLEDKDGLTPKAVEALWLYIYIAKLQYGDLGIVDHNDWRVFGGTPTTCAGPEIDAYINFLRALG